MPSNILFILAAISFGISAVKEGWVGINWTPAGFCFLTIALWLA